MQEQNQKSPEFSSRLADLMAEAKLNKTSLAKVLRTTHSTVWRWLEGTIPRRRTLAELAAALGTTQEWLITGRGDRHDPLGRSIRQEDPAEHRTAASDVSAMAIHFRNMDSATLCGVIQAALTEGRQTGVVSEHTLETLQRGTRELLRRHG